jgi:thiopeptide-type bacteriocin biosynthesis protein
MLQSESYFVIRIPLLPYYKGNHASKPELESVFSEPLLQEALFLASPSLYERLKEFLKGNLSALEVERIRLSLNRYLLRLTSRSTPFGLFAGVSIGKWSDSTKATLSDSVHRCTRLDNDYVGILVESLLQLPEVSQKVKFFPNDTVYVVDNKIRYVEYRQTRGKRTHHLSCLENSSYLSTILNQAKQGSSKFSLAQCIVSDEIDYTEALSFIEEIIENNLLVSELNLKLTGEDYFAYVRRVLNKHEIRIPLLDEIGNCLNKLDSQTSDANLLLYPELINKLRQLTNADEPKHYIQVDSRRVSQIKVNRRVAASIAEIANLLANMPARQNKTIQDFKRAFFARYEFQVIELGVALDPEIGLGYPVPQEPSLAESSLLDGICFQEEKKIVTAELSEFQNFLIRKYSDVLPHQKPIILCKEEIEPFCRNTKLSSSSYAVASVYAASEEAVDAGNCTIYVSKIVGPSAAITIGRFCHLDPELTTMLKSTLQKEELNQDAVFAEIIHASQARMGNISSRPVLREYEIPILATSGVDDDHTLPIRDLTLSIVDNRLILRSKKLNKEVIPRLSSAHNFSHDTISVYRFLCDLQHQEANTFAEWDWGILNSAAFLPTVRIDNIIVSPARWRLSVDEVSAVRNTKNLLHFVRTLRERRQIPEKITMGPWDRKIAINLENEDHLLVFQKLVEETDILEECFLHEEHLFIKDKRGNGYAHELIVPLINISQEINCDKPGGDTRLTTSENIQRDFALGSEWLYYKIYCNVKAVDQILLDIIKPLTTSLLKEGVIDKWFFIRYNDPQNHIRLRFHGKMSFYHTIIEKFQEIVKTYIEIGLISGIVIDTYKRELERYGCTSITESESLFFVDSESTLQFLANLENNEMLRWQIGLLEANELFNIFNISIVERRTITQDLQQQFFKEMKADQLLKQSLASSLRNNRKTIEDVLQGSGLSNSIISIMAGRSQQLKPIAVRILEKASAGELQVSVPALLKSYLHMSFNRLFVSHPRHHEMVLYDFLYKFYNSQLARAGKT